MAKAPEKPPLQALKPNQLLKPGISKQQIFLIGRATVSWAWLEACMQDVLWAMLGVPIEDGRIVTQRTDATRNIQWMRGFSARHLAGDELAEMKAILDDIEILQADRNFIVHGSWGTLMPNDVPLATSVREKPDEPDRIIAETFPQGRMEDIIVRIDAAKAKLIAWREKHEASRGKPSLQPTSG